MSPTNNQNMDQNLKRNLNQPLWKKLLVIFKNNLNIVGQIGFKRKEYTIMKFITVQAFPQKQWTDDNR